VRLLVALLPAFFYYGTLVSCCQLLYAAGKQDALIAAAADLTPSGNALADEFERLTGNRVRFVFAASGILAEQTAAGAPYDVLLLANISYIRTLEKSGNVIPDTIKVYAVGRLAFWSAEGLGWRDLTTPKVRHLAIANPTHAPYGMAAKAALEKAGLWSQLEPKIVFGENVQQALQFAKSGNADVAITARSLVPDGELVDPRLYSPIEQGAAVVKGAAHESLARDFIRFLSSTQGQAVLKKFGFDPPPAR
jgi:molybdate transport system substrate-binding protein